ncbi:transglycosylase [Paenibacillus darwinianus]|uniref:Transglycosylase n=1 Tax=Paenibacillus darwinianus TaxID=1380763 RepID=A0A9W5S2F8_9BACL|nr:PBP1A family penicillin-binding protein [Paenibacillus darwinianus]EXX89830.1 transglycosylase [Paenibacillus darwinianus]EXX90214.1 transglycosylase [Paenibacillus darwinianus]EXX90636.1 transglycosylase [Paenibacillus darwinianus]
MTEKRAGQTSGNANNASKRVNKGKQKKPGKKIGAILFFTVATAIICGIIGYLLIMLNGERILAANQGAFDFAETSAIYDANGIEVSKLYASENREYADLSKIPKLLQDAFIATEDRRFREHSGVDFWAIGRAVVKDVVARSAVEGGSTITQQLAKNMFLTRDKTFFRKASEASIAVALENKKTKDEILELYLNRIYFGKGAYGVQAASELYFGKKDLNQLKLWEMATLAGMPKAPNGYNPIGNPERSRERMGVVLDLMLDQGLITSAQAEEAKAEAEQYEPPETTRNGTLTQAYPAYVDFVVNEAERVTGLTEEELRLGGYNIYTTLNVKAQQVVEKEFANPDNFEKSVDEQIVQGAMIIMDHRTGEIEAIGGGREYEKKGTNRVLEPRQPGSAFKPITVYGPALETGDWFPWSILRDDKKCYGNYCPTDSNRIKHIGAISMEQSLKESRNASAVWLLNEIGIQRGLDFAKTLGFQLTKEDRNLAIALGGLYKGVTPMQMATAYSVIANGGKSVDPHSIVRIESKDGSMRYQYEKPRVKQLMKPETAWYLTELMRTVVQKGGTGTRAAIGGREVAGKTGTTQHGIEGFNSSGNRDVWFAGYTPEWTAAVWMGYVKTDREHVLKKSSGMAASLFSKVMSQALEGVPSGKFTRPKGVKTIEKPPTVGGFSVVWNEAEQGVQLSWNRLSGEGLAYNLYRKETSESEFALISQTSDSSALDRAVQPNLTYEYYVAAYYEQTGAEGDTSSRQSITIPEPLAEPVPPDQPGELMPGNGAKVPEGGANVPPEGGGAGIVPPDGGIDIVPPDGGTGNNGAAPPSGDGTTPPADGAGTPPADPAAGGTPTDPGTGAAAPTVRNDPAAFLP